MSIEAGKIGEEPNVPLPQQKKRHLYLVKPAELTTPTKIEPYSQPEKDLIEEDQTFYFSSEDVTWHHLPQPISSAKRPTAFSLETNLPITYANSHKLPRIF